MSKRKNRNKRKKTEAAPSPVDPATPEAGPEQPLADDAPVELTDEAPTPPADDGSPAEPVDEGPVEPDAPVPDEETAAPGDQADADEPDDSAADQSDTEVAVAEDDATPSPDEGESAEAASASDDEADTADEEAGPPPEISTERVVEAVLFVADAPMTLQKIVSVLGTGSAREVRKIIKTLNVGYKKAGHAFRIEEIAGGYQLLTLPEYNTWLRRLKQSRQETKLSPAAMETLAVVAYKQPVVRAEIEAVRGVAAGEMLNRLRELGLIKIVGRAEDVGRPMLYGTTRHFLEVFGLGNLEDLPAVEELQMPK